MLLVALGFWTDGSGKREIVDWQVADSESKAAWETLVNRLWERGLRPENGLQAVIRDGCGELGDALALVYGSSVVEQRCIFHKLRNVADKCREELKGEVNKQTRKQLMEQASAIYQAERTNRELRRKLRQAGCFGSPKGAEVAIFLQVQRLNARWSKQTGWETSHSLYFDFLALHP